MSKLVVSPEDAMAILETLCTKHGCHPQSRMPWYNENIGIAYCQSSECDNEGRPLVDVRFDTRSKYGLSGILYHEL
jgi:hypothetical protein